MFWCPRTDSNRGPIDYKSIALPAELQGLKNYLLINRLINNIYQLLNLCLTDRYLKSI